MAEALALGASVIAVLQIADRLVGVCKFYIESVGEAAADLHTILLEASILKTIFETLNFLKVHNEGTCTLLEALSGKDGPIEGCRRSIEALEGLFPSGAMEPVQQHRSKRQKVKHTWNALAWPLKIGRAKRILEDIVLHKTTITLALTAAQSQDISFIKTKTADIYEIVTEGQARDVYKWLKHTDPSPLHNKALKQYETGTGDWILRLPDFQSWLNTEIRCLWIYGIPGAGKTILISHLIENLKEHCQHLRDKTVAYAYYYAYFGHDQDESEPFLRWIIAQICQQKGALPIRLYQMYKTGEAPSLLALMTALEDVLKDLDVVYIFLDAIDESSPREDLLKILRDLATDARFRKIQILVSSRNYIDIEKTMDKISKSISMSNSFVEDDIRTYVKSTLSSSSRFSRWPQELLIEAEIALAKGAEGMFRWAVCQLHMLQRVKPDRKIVHETLKTLPKTLDETYDRIFLSISQEDALIVHETFQWIHYHSKLDQGLSITCPILLQGIEKSMEKNGNKMHEDLHHERLRELCGCLITTQLEAPRGYLKEHEFKVLHVSFAHYTVFEYLTSARISNGPAARFSLHGDSVSPIILETVFSEAINVPRGTGEPWEYLPAGPTETIEELTRNFKVYSVFSSVLSMKAFAHQISRNQLLCALVIDLVDPSRVRYEDFCWVAREITQAGLFDKADLSDSTNFWEIVHSKDYPDVHTHQLFNLLCLSKENKHITEIVNKFMETKSSRTLLQNRMEFDKLVLGLFHDDPDTYRFKGTIVEVFSQLANTYEHAFKFLLEYGEGIFDPSEIILLYVGFHEHDERNICKDYCPLARLLRLGARPNVSGYKVLPLQIAVNAQDFESVRLLLEVGADPNEVGDSDGKSWEDKTLMSHFNHLQNASPLHICRNLEGAFFSGWDYDQDSRSKEKEKIDAVLVQHGAKEFIRDDDEPMDDLEEN